MPDLDRASLRSACQALGLKLSGAELKLLERYAGLLHDWNQRINLISRKDTDRILSYHVIDSLAVSHLIPTSARVCDIGTGAGLPGIPLAIARPDTEMVLVESSRKRCLFLHDAVQTLGISTATIINNRSEAIPSLECDTIVSRLTAPLRRALKQMHHHRQPEGLMIFYKATDSATETDDVASILSKYRLAVVRTEDVVLPVTGMTRRFVIIGSA